MSHGTIALPGNPQALLTHVNTLDATTQALESAIDLLDAITLESRGLAVDALYERAVTTRADLSQSVTRYDGTGAALRTYQVSLSDAHQTVRGIQQRYDDALQDYSRADYRFDEAWRELRLAHLRGAEEAEITSLENDKDIAYNHRESAQSRMNDEQAAFARVSDSLEDAAERAIVAIDAAFGSTNDSWGDKARHAISGVISAIGALSEWALGVLNKVLEVIGEIIKAIVVIITIVLIAVVLIALAVVLAVILAVVIAAIITLAILIVVHLILTLAGVAILAVGMEILDIPNVLRVRIAAAYVTAVSPLLGTWISINALQDALSKAPTPQEVTSAQDAADALGVDSLTEQQLLAYDLLMSDTPVTSAEQLAQLVAAVDTLGGSGATFVVVKTIPGPPEQHIVLTPSTQEWNFWGDGGAMNDFGGALGLGTDMWDSQFERFVVDALQAAEVGQGEPIFLAGFSQGSMVNMEIARDYDQFTVGGAVNFGGPVNLSPYTGDAPMVEIRNSGNLGPFSFPDPVSLLDFNNSDFSASHGQTFVGNAGQIQPHAMDQYARLVEPGPAADAILDAFGPVVGQDHSTTMYVGVEGN